MIITRVNGGTGNQLFQYAIARQLAEIHKVPVLIDDWTKKEGVPRDYQLTHFNITGRRWSSGERLAFRLRQKLAKTIPGLKGLAYRNVVEQGEDFDPKVLESGKKIYLKGFWQTEKYFKDIAPIIRQEFTVNSVPDRVNQAMLNDVLQHNSVMLHVRRGDYVSNPDTNKYHGTASIEYYQKCIELIKSKVKDPHFYVFSDDPEWAKQNIRTGCPTVVPDYNQNVRDHEDFRFMYSCKHFIIANSTYSWWAAWLCTNADKIVCAPQTWYANADRSAKDLVPTEWLRI